MTDDPELWASILGWHCWRDAAGIWYTRQTGASPAAVLRAASLDALRVVRDHVMARLFGPPFKWGRKADCRCICGGVHASYWMSRFASRLGAASRRRGAGEMATGPIHAGAR